MTVVHPPGDLRDGRGLDLAAAAAAPAPDVAAALGSGAGGLADPVAADRLAADGPNAVRIHQVRPWAVLARQLRSPLLLLLAVTAAASALVGEATDAVVIAVILLGSVGLGFVNELRAETAAVALHTQVRRTCTVLRGGRAQELDVTGLVAGDVVELRLGQVVPADVRLLEVSGLACDESVLTGESLPVAKDTGPVPPGSPLAELRSCALMGTVVQAGSARGVVVATGPRAVFGKVATDLGTTEPDTAFQQGLRRFSVLLVQVAAVLTAAILVINLALHRPFLDAVLFSLAIAVGISPQLLPAVVATSMAAGSRRLARRRVLVKRLVAIEDLGDVDLLLTDKTGTLTDGRIRFLRATDDETTVLGLVCTEETVGGNPLDVALAQAPLDDALRARAAAWRRVDVRPFDHERRLVSVLADAPDGTGILVTKGAPEEVFARAARVPDALRAATEREFAAGNRVVAVATRPATSLDDEQGFEVRGLLAFLDPPKASAGPALARLAGLGVTVKVVTGDNGAVARRVCGELGLPAGGVLTGNEVDAADDAGLVVATVYARVTPEQKARIVRAHRTAGRVTAFLGDGVNDAVALHAADVGISVDSGTDVAKDAADVILLEKDLDVLADGVVEGRRIFANTITYVRMGTSSNLGNMLSAAIASAFLSFLPMLPSQILLNNLLYDTSQLAIPTDEADPERLARPARWDVADVRRFMLVFGPLSSVFDLATFAVMLRVFHAPPPLFRAGWFVESLATQTLVVLVIRTARVPFWRSRPSRPLLLAVLAVATTGALLPLTPLAAPLGFDPLPGAFYALLAGFVVAYLGLVELTLWLLGRGHPVAPAPPRRARRGHEHRLHRRAAPFSTRAQR